MNQFSRQAVEFGAAAAAVTSTQRGVTEALPDKKQSRGPAQREEKCLKKQQKIKICKLYYHEGLSKVEIAEKTRISRFKVAKIIEEAVADGIVEIKIKNLPGTYPDIESELEKKYKIYTAIVTGTGRKR